MNWNQPNVYAVQHKNEDVRAESRSGGVFTAISDCVLEKGGVVYGCILDDHFNAVHTRAENVENRKLMRGSKYIQSKMGDTYKQVEKDLIDGRVVLFSGTPCQVAGLKHYLREEYDNLLCVDIVCHGVPSPMVWERYLQWQEKKNKSKVNSADFRNKKDFGWREHIETLSFVNGKKTNSKVFTTLFYGHSILRPCCYECPYKSIIHPGDITIADYWGIEKAAPEFDDNKGVSLVLVNNVKGQKCFDLVKERVKWKETRIEDSMQQSLKAPYPEPPGRKKFWDDFSKRDFDYITRKYGDNGVLAGIRRILKKIKRRLCG